MWRDYKNRTARRPSTPAIPGWLWLLAGLALGLIVALVVYLMKLPPQVVPGAVSTAQPYGTAPATPLEHAKSATSQPVPAATVDDRFRFFDELPNMGVEVPPDTPRPASKPAPPPAPPTPPVANAAPPKVNPDLPKHSASLPPPAVKRGDAYVLQVGSYRNFREADGIKARLTLMGLDASVQRVTVDRKETWYRVRVGPYTSADNANRVRDQLRRNKFKAIVLKLRG